MLPLQQRLTNRRLLHRGDLASCYRARDVRLDRIVFLKVLHPALTADAEIRARFEREARAAARIDHPNLVRLHEYGEDADEGYFMVFEWVEGKSLRELLDAGTEFDSDLLRTIAIHVLKALQALHSSGILHRDIKPDNVLLGDDGRVRVTDFSLAALQGAAQLTHHQAIVGTPAYMSPEQAAGKPADERSELFSLGVVLCELTTGNNPFAAEDMLETLRRVREKEVSRENLPTLPDEMQGFVLRLVSKPPAHRPASAAAALEALGEEAEPTGVNYRQARREFRPMILLGGLAVFILIVLVGWQRYSMVEKTEPDSEALIADTSTIRTSTPIVTIESDSMEQRDAGVSFKQRIADVDSSQNPVIDSIKRSDDTIPNSDAEQQSSSMATSSLDSLSVMLTTTPWAHVSIGGRMLGTTPLSDSIKLPTGKQVFTFLNTAFPPIQAKIEPQPGGKLHVDLLEYVMTLELSVEPWGEVYLNGEHVGTTPLTRPVFLLPGTHELRITHPTLSTLSRTLKAVAGDTAHVIVDLTDSDLAIRYKKKLGNE